MEVWMSLGVYEGVDYTGYYQVSSKGRVRSLDRNIIYKNGRNRLHKGKILGQWIDRCGYIYTVISKDGKDIKAKVHRLIALRFIPNLDPQHKTEVNHIDENKTNNCVENLEWVTPKENCNHGTRTERMKQKQSFRIAQLDQFGNLLKTWASISDAEVYGFNSSGIRKVLSNNKKYHGYIWARWETFSKNNPGFKYEDFLNNKVNIFNESYEKCYSEKKRKIVQLNCDGEFISSYNSISDAQKAFNKGNGIACCLCGKSKTAYGYKWMYLEDYQNSIG